MRTKGIKEEPNEISLATASVHHGAPGGGESGGRTDGLHAHTSGVLVQPDMGTNRAHYLRAGGVTGADACEPPRCSLSNSAAPAGSSTVSSVVSESLQKQQQQQQQTHQLEDQLQQSRINASPYSSSQLQQSRVNMSPYASSLVPSFGTGLFTHSSAAATAGEMFVNSLRSTSGLEPSAAAQWFSSQGYGRDTIRTQDLYSRLSLSGEFADARRGGDGCGGLMSSNYSIERFNGGGGGGWYGTDGRSHGGAGGVGSGYGGISPVLDSFDTVAARMGLSPVAGSGLHLPSAATASRQSCQLSSPLTSFRSPGYYNSTEPITGTTAAAAYNGYSVDSDCSGKF